MCIYSEGGVIPSLVVQATSAKAKGAGEFTFGDKRHFVGGLQALTWGGAELLGNTEVKYIKICTEYPGQWANLA